MSGIAVVRVRPVVTERLALVSIPEGALRDLAAGRQARAERALRVRLPDGFAERRSGLFRRRLADVERDPRARPWLLRLITLRAEDRPTGLGRTASTEPLVAGARRTAVGVVGFHGPPDRRGRAEIGYEVFPAFRRRGYAREAVGGMFAWAARTHGVSTFIASIAPDNEPSMRLARGLGFRQVGAQIDEEDGLEFVYVVEWPR